MFIFQFLFLTILILFFLVFALLHRFRFEACIRELYFIIFIGMLIIFVFLLYSGWEFRDLRIFLSFFLYFLKFYTKSRYWLIGGCIMYDFAVDRVVNPLGTDIIYGVSNLYGTLLDRRVGGVFPENFMKFAQNIVSDKYDISEFWTFGHKRTYLECVYLTFYGVPSGIFSVWFFVLGFNFFIYSLCFIFLFWIPVKFFSVYTKFRYFFFVCFVIALVVGLFGLFMMLGSLLVQFSSLSLFVHMRVDRCHGAGTIGLMILWLFECLLTKYISSFLNNINILIPDFISDWFIIFVLFLLSIFIIALICIFVKNSFVFDRFRKCFVYKVISFILKLIYLYSFVLVIFICVICLICIHLFFYFFLLNTSFSFLWISWSGLLFHFFYWFCFYGFIFCILLSMLSYYCNNDESGFFGVLPEDFFIQFEPDLLNNKEPIAFDFNQRSGCYRIEFMRLCEIVQKDSPVVVPVLFVKLKNFLDKRWIICKVKFLDFIDFEGIMKPNYDSDYFMHELKRYLKK